MAVPFELSLNSNRPNTCALEVSVAPSRSVIVNVTAQLTRANDIEIKGRAFKCRSLVVQIGPISVIAWSRTAVQAKESCPPTFDLLELPSNRATAPTTTTWSARAAASGGAHDDEPQNPRASSSPPHEANVGNSARAKIFPSQRLSRSPPAHFVANTSPARKTSLMCARSLAVDADLDCSPDTVRSLSGNVCYEPRRKAGPLSKASLISQEPGDH